MSPTEDSRIPLNAEVESASTYEGHVAEKTIDGIAERKHTKRQRKAIRLVPVRVISDKGYDEDGLRERVAMKGVDFIAPYRENRVK